jgi:uncharacterized protein YecT (DUF1311 family)
MLYAVDCDSATTTMEMKECAYQELQQVDKELNQVYRALIKRLDKEGKAKLKSAQRAWIAYRDAEAEFAADAARGGSMSGLLHTGSLTDATQKRIEELKNAMAAY